MRLSQVHVLHMKKVGYSYIIFTTSISSKNKSPNMSGYVGCKTAVNHTLAYLAHDFVREVGINAIGQEQQEQQLWKAS